MLVEQDRLVRCTQMAINCGETHGVSSGRTQFCGYLCELNATGERQRFSREKVGGHLLNDFVDVACFLKSNLLQHCKRGFHFLDAISIFPFFGKTPLLGQKSRPVLIQNQ